MAFVIKIQGGLGNQMFQYSFYRKMMKLHGENKVSLDLESYNENNFRVFELTNVFGVKYQVAKKNIIQELDPTIKEQFLKIHKRKTLFKPNRYKHFDLTYDPKFFLVNKKKAYLKGYWQSEKYFVDIKDEIRETFMFKDIDSQNIELSKKINSLNSVSIHVRRKDYLSHKSLHVCNLDYYAKAIKSLSSKQSNLEFFVFSDDPVWCKKHFPKTMNYITLNQKEKNYQDMFLMSRCKHNIIANSSFSWWGAYLNDYNNKIVIAPNVWFGKTNPSKTNINDIIPECWIKLDFNHKQKNNGF